MSSWVSNCSARAMSRPIAATRVWPTHSSVSFNGSAGRPGSSAYLPGLKPLLERSSSGYFLNLQGAMGGELSTCSSSGVPTAGHLRGMVSLHLSEPARDSAL